MDRDEFDLPKPLRDDLSSLYRADVRVSAELDRLTTSRARAHFAKPGRSRWIRWAAGAAGVAAVVLISIVLLRDPGQPQVASTALVGDANRDGIVDIRDALVLARKIEAGPVDVTSREDLNNDRAIDRKDVDAIAMLAVRLGPEVVR
jgi:hypothetical protein